MAVKIKLSEGEVESLGELAFWSQGVAKSAATSNQGDEEVRFWDRAKSVDEALGKAIENIESNGEVSIHEGFLVELTDEAIAWAKDMRTELAQTVEQARGTVEFNKEDVVTIFVLDTIAKQLDAVAPNLKAVA
jgi:hypothetical protein